MPPNSLICHILCGDISGNQAEPSANFQGDDESAPGRRTTPGPMASESCVLRTPQNAARLPSAVEAGSPVAPF